MMGRLATAGLGLLLAGCGVTVTSDVDRRDEPITATAYSKVDGIETWDLTGEPSRTAFGIKADSSAGTYETDEPRRVRIVLPGRTVDLDANLVSFYAGSNDYTFGVSTDQLAVDPLLAAFSDVLGQLGIDDGIADDLARQIEAAPPDQPESIEVGTGNDRSVRLGSWSVGPSATYTPLGRLGRVVLGGSWPATP